MTSRIRNRENNCQLTIGIRKLCSQLNIGNYRYKGEHSRQKPRSYHAHQAVPRGTRDGELMNKRRATRDHEAGNECPNREPQVGQYKKKLKYINNKGESRVKDF